MDWIFNGEYSAETFVAAVIALILTDQLVIGRRLRRAERERDEWRNIAFRLLGITTTVVEDESSVTAVLKQAKEQMNEGKEE